MKVFLGYPLSYYTFSTIALYLKKQVRNDVDIVVNIDSGELAKLARDDPFLKIFTIDQKAELVGGRIPKPAVIMESLQ